MPQPDTEQQPIFQHLLQLLAALFQSCRVCPHAWESGDFTVLQTVILKNFVDGLMHRRVYVLGKHGSVWATRRITSERASKGEAIRRGYEVNEFEQWAACFVEAT